jgi:two-component system, LuxR family, secretion system response regulator SsrB
MGGGEAIRVAIAEDNELMLDGVQFLLEQHGDLNVIAAVRSGTEALEIAARSEVDVLVLDLGLPDLDGTEVLRYLQGRDGAPRVVVCSAYSDAETRRQALAGGAAAFVVKDRIAAELPAAIRQSAARR